MSNTAPAEVTSSAPMPPVTTGRSEQVAIRIPHDQMERCKALQTALTRPGLEAPSMAEVLRAIVAKGLDAWEEELEGDSPSPKKKTGRGR